MKIISKYIFKEILLTWSIVMITLFVILMSSQFAEILNQAATGKIPRDFILNTLILTSVQYMNIIIPFGLFIGVMLTLAKLNQNSEIVALKACAIGPSQLLIPIMFLSIMLSILVSWLSLHVSPNALNEIEKIKMDAGNEIRTGMPEAGKFIPFNNNQAILFVKEIEGTEFKDIFIQQDYNDRQTIILAEKGKKISASETGEIIFSLENGRRYDGKAGDKKFQIIDFKQHNIPIFSNSTSNISLSSKNKTTIQLLLSNNIQDQAELQWRLSAPISIFLLSLLALSLISTKPRQGYYSQLGIGILIYMIYINCLTLGKAWIEREILLSWVGLWVIHLIVASLALFLFAQQSGFNIYNFKRKDVYNR
ncbi:MAG: LPS export ABC transporter permease LptF [Gammaproteobacteria bacterium TMED78]|nr:MAG: LPS export ABC transporter permease LptF [Gammaproteobacteria bacterium TMED78]